MSHCQWEEHNRLIGMRIEKSEGNRISISGGEMRILSNQSEGGGQKENSSKKRREDANSLRGKYSNRHNFIQGKTLEKSNLPIA